MKKIPKNQWEDCPNCNNEGSYMTGGIHYVTRDMALDACEPDMEGMPIDQTEHIQCEFCWRNPNSIFNQKRLREKK
jgi:hypothetical protein